MIQISNINSVDQFGQISAFAPKPNITQNHKIQVSLNNVLTINSVENQIITQTDSFTISNPSGKGIGPSDSLTFNIGATSSFSLDVIQVIGNTVVLNSTFPANLQNQVINYGFFTFSINNSVIQLSTEIISSNKVDEVASGVFTENFDTNGYLPIPYTGSLATQLMYPQNTTFTINEFILNNFLIDFSVFFNLPLFTEQSIISNLNKLRITCKVIKANLAFQETYIELDSFPYLDSANNAITVSNVAIKNSQNQLINGIDLSDDCFLEFNTNGVFPSDFVSLNFAFLDFTPSNSSAVSVQMMQDAVYEQYSSILVNPIIAETIPPNPDGGIITVETLSVDIFGDSKKFFYKISANQIIKDRLIEGAQVKITLSIFENSIELIGFFTQNKDTNLLNIESNNKSQVNRAGFQTSGGFSNNFNPKVTIEDQMFSQMRVITTGNPIPTRQGIALFNLVTNEYFDLKVYVCDTSQFIMTPDGIVGEFTNPIDFPTYVLAGENNLIFRVTSVAGVSNVLYRMNYRVDWRDYLLDTNVPDEFYNALLPLNGKNKNFVPYGNFANLLLNPNTADFKLCTFVELIKEGFTYRSKSFIDVANYDSEVRINRLSVSVSKNTMPYTNPVIFQNGNYNFNISEQISTQWVSPNVEITIENLTTKRRCFLSSNPLAVLPLGTQNNALYNLSNSIQENLLLDVINNEMDIIFSVNANHLDQGENKMTIRMWSKVPGPTVNDINERQIYNFTVGANIAPTKPRRKELQLRKPFRDCCPVYSVCFSDSGKDEGGFWENDKTTFFVESTNSVAELLFFQNNVLVFSQPMNLFENSFNYYYFQLDWQSFFLEVNKKGCFEVKTKVTDIDNLEVITTYAVFDLQPFRYDLNQNKIRLRTVLGGYNEVFGVDFSGLNLVHDYRGVGNFNELIIKLETNTLISSSSNIERIKQEHIKRYDLEIGAVNSDFFDDLLDFQLLNGEFHNVIDFDHDAYFIENERILVIDEESTIDANNLSGIKINKKGLNINFATKKRNEINHFNIINGKIFS